MTLLPWPQQHRWSSPPCKCSESQRALIRFHMFSKCIKWKSKPKSAWLQSCVHFPILHPWYKYKEFWIWKLSGFSGTQDLDPDWICVVFWASRDWKSPSSKHCVASKCSDTTGPHIHASSSLDMGFGNTTAWTGCLYFVWVFRAYRDQQGQLSTSSVHSMRCSDNFSISDSRNEENCYQ